MGFHLIKRVIGLDYVDMIPPAVSFLFFPKLESSADCSVLCWSSPAFGPVEDGRSFITSYSTYCEMSIQVSLTLPHSLDLKVDPMEC
jgi:hypothetical protein